MATTSIETTTAAQEGAAMAATNGGGVDSSSLSSTFITELRCNDVLHGRGAAYDRMEGNIRFRSLIKQRANEYRDADTNEKKRLAQQIVDQVHATNGRFLRVIDSIPEAELHQLAPGELGWLEVEPSIALEKVKQALRDAKRQESSSSQSVSSPPSPPGATITSPSSFSSSSSSTSSMERSGLIQRPPPSRTVIEILDDAPSPATTTASTVQLPTTALDLASLPQGILNGINLNAIRPSVLQQALLARRLGNQNLSSGLLSGLGGAATGLGGMVSSDSSSSAPASSSSSPPPSLWSDEQYQLHLMERQALDSQIAKLQMLRQRQDEQQHQATAVALLQQKQRQEQQQASLLQGLVSSSATATQSSTATAALQQQLLLRSLQQQQQQAKRDQLAAAATSNVVARSQSPTTTSAAAHSMLLDAALPSAGKPFTGKTLLIMLRAQVLAETANDIPFLRKILSVYKTVVENPLSHRLSPGEKQNLIDAVKSVHGAIRTATVKAATSTEAAAASLSASLQRQQQQQQQQLRQRQQQLLLQQQLRQQRQSPSVAAAMPRISTLPTAISSRLSSSSSTATAPPTASGVNPAVLARATSASASTPMSLVRNQSKGLSPERSALIANCAPTRRKRGYLDESQKALDEFRAMQQKKARQQAQQGGGVV